MSDAFAPPIPEEAKAIAAPLLNLFENLCLISGFYQGKPVTMVCNIHTNPDGYEICPRFIVLTSNMLSDCGDCSNQPPTSGGSECQRSIHPSM